MNTLPLGERWLDCILVYRAGDVGGRLEGRDAEIGKALEQHLATYPAAACHGVWFDTIAGICFSAAQLKGGPSGKDYSFLAEAEQFAGSVWGTRYVEGAAGCNEIFRTYPVTFDSEHAYGHPPAFHAVKGRRVLLVLGGPTTKRVNWEAVETDHLWSCNKFYLNPRVEREDLDLLALAPDVPLGDNPGLHRYLANHPDTRLAFELERGGPVGSWRPVNQFVARYPERCGFFHTRYQSALGLGARLILLAIFLGAAEVAFVGLDGMTPDGPLHSFEPYKTNPLWYGRFGPALQRRQYVLFWEYVLSLRARREFRLLNLGEIGSVNLSRTISARHFPLPRAVQQRLRRPIG